ncbi:hypothetical protein [Pseudoalteromonas sp.]|uniref:hypothetical protein n=1 Tax=Pseudoalteromonas sp. TaxID=53249 RepID=UPI00262E83FA|nr:hypothetical protein [Pseudoalteromonas sp.]MCP3865007.1 hypothetical protein [Aestuariibacter sp.]MCP4584592.1 hypothetical protein [Pseudoalteromonas sp.]
MGAIQQLAVNLKKAKDHDAASIKWLLREVQNLLKMGAVLPEELNSWLCSVLDELLEDKPDELSTRLKLAKKGRPESHNEEMRELIARSVHNIRNQHGLHKSENGAYTIIAEQYGISANTAEKYYKEFQIGFELDEDIRRETEGK